MVSFSSLCYAVPLSIMAGMHCIILSYFFLGLCDNVSISHFIIDHRKYIFVHANFD